MAESEWMTTKEIAARLRVTRQTVGRWVRAGRLPAEVRSSPSRRVVYWIRVEDYRDFVKRYIHELRG